MKLRPGIVILLLLATGSLVVSFGAARLRGARDRTDASLDRLDAIAHDAQSILDLRARRQQVAAGQPPEQDVIARVTATLTGVGLPAEYLTNLAQDSDAPVQVSPDGGSTYRRQSIGFTLTPIATHELGAFFERWHADQPLWTPTSITLTHNRGAEDASYTARITIAATYSPHLSFQD